jgi:hypothetical protein
VRMVDVASGTVSTFGSGVNNTFTTVSMRRGVRIYEKWWC